MVLHHGGFPIRKSADQCLFTTPRSLSQLIASFFGSWCQGIHLTLLFAWTSYCCSLYELSEFHFEHWLFTLREKALNCLLLNVYFHLAISRVGEIVVITLDIGKTLNSIDLVNLMSSISVRFNSFLFFYSIFNERKDLILSDLIFFCHRGLKFQLIAVLPRSLAPGTAGWSVWMDSNHRPHAYQACALTTWATNRFALTHLD